MSLDTQRLLLMSWILQGELFRAPWSGPQNKAAKYVLLQECARHMARGPAELLVGGERRVTLGFALTPSSHPVPGRTLQ